MARTKKPQTHLAEQNIQKNRNGHLTLTFYLKIKNIYFIYKRWV